ncbi:protein O-linked-mannose beta-1,2-N-acetylglucosaminyltransferase 1-like [Glandiceps talaboti]
MSWVAVLFGRRTFKATVIRLFIILFGVVILYNWYSNNGSNLPSTDFQINIDQFEKVETAVVTEEKPKEEYDSRPKCGNIDPCKKIETSFHLKSGNAQLEAPSICLNDIYIIGRDPNFVPSRGMNIAIIDETSQNVISKEVFDLYDYDSSKLLEFLSSVQNSQILLLATFDDAAAQLSSEARQKFKEDFGSTMIQDLNYRGNWVFIGQKGVPDSPYRHEKIYLFNKEEGEWAAQIEITGCLPLIPAANEQSEDAPKTKLDTTMKCGLNAPCSVDEVAVSAHSGYVEKDKVFPSVCVDGYVVMGPKVNTPGRGFNIVTVNSETKKLEKYRVFDTYESEEQSRKVGEFLESVPLGHLVIVTTYDEASQQLTYEATSALIDVGSGQIHLLEYRDSYILIGQKGLKGVSPYEKLGAKQDQSWGPKVEIKECIPKIIEPEEGVQPVVNNRKRQEFCRQYEGYEDFCSEDKVKELLLPIPLEDESLRGNKAYSTPIIVIPGVDLNALRIQLDSLLTIPGLNPQMVMVANDGDFAEPIALTQLYGFRPEKLKVTTQYHYHMHKAMEVAFIKYPQQEYIIMLEEQFEVSPDFLNYFAQTLPLLDKDQSIISVSVWNNNGFMDTCGDPALLYRTENFPGYGWVLRRSVWNEMKDKLKQCCDTRVWHEWMKGELRKGREMVVPDVSRLNWFKKDIFNPEQDFIDVFFVNRKSIGNNIIKLRDVDNLVNDEYEKEIIRLLASSTNLGSSYTNMCLQGKTDKFTKQDGYGKVYTIYYEEKDNSGGQISLKRLCKCFGLFSMDNFSVKGLHKGLLRFYYQGNHFMLIGSQSPYFAKKRADDTVIQV